MADTNSSQKVIRHYLQEIESLRDEGQIFSQSYPDVAAELGIGPDHWTDPQAEMLLQSFAYLTARVRNQIDIDKSAVPNALLDHLCPYMQAPVPCMTIAEAQVVAATADGRPLERGRMFSVEAYSGTRKINCHFKNCYETPIWPLEISSLSSIPVSDLDFLSNTDNEQDQYKTQDRIYSTVRVSIRSLSKIPIKEMGIEQRGLRFYVSDKSKSAMRLYEMLNTGLCKIYVRPRSENGATGPSEQQAVQELSPESLIWKGFEDEDAVLPDSADMHPGYRLLREYFSFPQKFLFFDINNMDLSESVSGFDLYFAFDEPMRSDTRLEKDSLKLNCFPLVNLSEQAIEPIRLTQRRYEYPVNVDRINQSYSEIYSIQSLYSIKTGEEARTLSPYFELSEFETIEERGYFYTFRRQLTENVLVPGTKAYLSFHDHNLSLMDIPAEAIGGTALCTNRRLPEKLNGQKVNLVLEGAGPIDGAVLASKVNPYSAPKLDSQSAWQLVSQLSLNFLSISGSEKALATFRHILKSYADMDNPMIAKQVLGIRSIRPERQSRYMNISGNEGMVQGIKLTMNLDENAFSEGRAILFASVCRYFFALYMSLGNFTQLTLETDKREEWKTWRPMAGALAEL